MQLPSGVDTILSVMTAKAIPVHIGSVQANAGHSPDAVSMLVQRLRRWSNIETALGECPVFAGVLCVWQVWTLSAVT